MTPEEISKSKAQAIKQINDDIARLEEKYGKGFTYKQLKDFEQTETKKQNTYFTQDNRSESKRKYDTERGEQAAKAEQILDAYEKSQFEKVINWTPFGSISTAHKADLYEQMGDKETARTLKQNAALRAPLDALGVVTALKYPIPTLYSTAGGYTSEQIGQKYGGNTGAFVGGLLGSTVGGISGNLVSTNIGNRFTTVMPRNINYLQSSPRLIETKQLLPTQQVLLESPTPLPVSRQIAIKSSVKTPQEKELKRSLDDFLFTHNHKLTPVVYDKEYITKEFGLSDEQINDLLLEQQIITKVPISLGPTHIKEFPDYAQQFVFAKSSNPELMQQLLYTKDKTSAEKNKLDDLYKEALNNITNSYRSNANKYRRKLTDEEINILEPDDYQTLIRRSKYYDPSGAHGAFFFDAVDDPEKVLTYFLTRNHPTTAKDVKSITSSVNKAASHSGLILYPDEYSYSLDSYPLYLRQTLSGLSNGTLLTNNKLVNEFNPSPIALNDLAVGAHWDISPELQEYIKNNSKRLTDVQEVAKHPIKRHVYGTIQNNIFSPNTGITLKGFSNNNGVLTESSNPTIVKIFDNGKEVGTMQRLSQDQVIDRFNTRIESLWNKYSAKNPELKQYYSPAYIDGREVKIQSLPVMVRNKGGKVKNRFK